ncbi:hypothetical protein BH10ACI1_BH10ACI1_34340 [soil metagenome]
MFYFDIKRVMRLRGVEKHYNLMLELGFVPSSANSFLRCEARQIKLDQLEKLCFALNCTPNDLLEWLPNTTQTVFETHSLNALRKKADKDLPELLNEVPLEKFEQIVEILQDLKDK